MISRTHTPPAGTKVAGHRGYYLQDVGVDLNQALIAFGLSFLRSKEFKKVQPPFFMNKAMMGKTAQLEEFDEALYKVSCCSFSWKGAPTAHEEYVRTARGLERGHGEVPHRYFGAADLRHARRRVVRPAE